MKILYFTKYSRLGASSRMRSFQYFPYLEEQGLHITVKPLFGDDYLLQLNSGKKSIYLVVIAYFRRFFTLFSVFKYDKIVLEKELFPYFPAVFEWILSLLKIKYIVDYDDAIFHNYDQHPNYWVKRILGDKIEKVMKYSFAVVAGNKYLAAKANEAGALKVFIIPTVVDLNRYTSKIERYNTPLVIGWIGTKSTFEKHLLPRAAWIKKAITKYPVEFHVVGVTNGLKLGGGVTYIPWSEETEVESILKFDVGIMPLEDSLWEKGKCSYKLIQYMACGLPVIASPVGMNMEVVTENLNGFLVSTEEEWLSAIELYVNDYGLRSAHGLKGRGMVEEKYCLQRANAILYDVLATKL